MATLGTFTAGQVLTAAELNAIGTWTSYTPTLTATVTNPTLGTGSIAEGLYTVVNKLAIIQIFFRFGSSGSSAGSGFYRISMPSGINLSSPQNNLGWSWLYDSGSATSYGAIFDRVNASTARMYIYGNPIEVANNNPFSWAGSDQIRGTIVARLD